MRHVSRLGTLADQVAPWLQWLVKARTKHADTQT
jgi:hypothetical protein